MNNLTARIVCLLLTCLAFNLSSQNVVVTDDGTYTPNASAMLDVKSDDKGLLIPRLTYMDRNNISSPAPAWYPIKTPPDLLCRVVPFPAS